MILSQNDEQLTVAKFANCVVMSHTIGVLF